MNSPGPVYFSAAPAICGTSPTRAPVWVSPFALEKQVTQAQNRQCVITIALLKCHIQAPLRCHSEIY